MHYVNAKITSWASKHKLNLLLTRPNEILRRPKGSLVELGWQPAANKPTRLSNLQHKLHNRSTSHPKRKNFLVLRIYIIWNMLIEINLHGIYSSHNSVTWNRLAMNRKCVLELKHSPISSCQNYPHISFRKYISRKSRKGDFK